MSSKKRKNEAIWIEKQERWQIKVQKDGQRRTFYSMQQGRKGKIEAEHKADDWMENVYGEDIRFRQLWDEFLAEIKDTTSSGNYRNHEYIGRKWILPTLLNKRVSAITRQNMQDCIKAGYKNGLSKKSLCNIRASLTAVYKYAKKRRIPLERPEDLTIPRGAKVGQRRILQPDDIRILFSLDTIKKNGRDVPAFYIHAWRFLVLTGLRPGEVYGLQKADIKNGIIHINRSVNMLNEQTQGKNENARRWFALPDMALKVLDDQAAMLQTHGIVSPWIFPNETGAVTEQTHAYNLWQTYRRQHDICSSVYEMRHTMISIVKADVPESLLKQMVGHSASMNTLGVYGHDVEGEAARTKTLVDGAYKRILGDK